MPTGPRSQFTIAKIMAVVAAVALMLGIIMTPGFAPTLGLVVIPSTIVGVGAYLGANRLIEIFYGHRCPGCRSRSLERRALVSFGERFFLCTRCGVRCRRGLFGGSSMFVWRDASGPEYEAIFQKAKEDDPWDLPPGLEDEEEAGVYSKTHLNLVRNKRRRSPENPNGPSLP